MSLHCLKRLAQVAQEATETNTLAASAYGEGAFKASVDQSMRSRLDPWEQAWYEHKYPSLYIGQTALCMHCSGLIIVIDMDANTTETVPLLGWRHVRGYYGCRAGLQPQAEPFIGKSESIQDYNDTIRYTEENAGLD